ncbi:predicted protein [Scheffersomyces stipitis CBS 6054]|uniref:AD domain-containing protein n=1 Tax=Scheffersomyces stipitis (strain ATCC 58785 / CBS 6054 / NBRC 10063 / NRRL Y-11545) TaxID=322104 RepID=A3LPE5_PICST|nr:predicted protein [Scheffersomyces stipitis CBS 6054]ABN64480.1 predicted protein [Scheffersomyces stipitis CBS 6054]
MSVSDFDQIVRLRAKITTLLDQSITGYVHSFSSSNQVIALRIDHKGKKSSTGDTYRIINTAFIKSIQILPPFPKKAEDLETHLQECIANFKPNQDLLANKENEPSHHSRASPIAIKLYEKFVKLYGPENIQWSGSDNIVIFKEIKLSKPYTLGKSGNIHKLKDNCKHLDEVQRVLKQFWLEVDNEKRGG